MKAIYHITELNWWDNFKDKVSYSTPTLKQEGFIHCSEEEHLQRVLGLYFQDKENLVLLHIDSDKVRAEIKYEIAPDGIYFPHIYGELNLDALIKVEDISLSKK